MFEVFCELHPDFLAELKIAGWLNSLSACGDLGVMHFYGCLIIPCKILS